MNMMAVRRHTKILSSALYPMCAAGIAAIGALLSISAASAQELRPLSVGLPNATMTGSYCMFPAAMQLGFFAEEKIDLKTQQIPGSATVLQAVMAGRIDIGGATPEPLLQAFSQDRDLAMIFNFIRRPTGSIAVLDESPIKSLTDFKGKKIGAQSLASGNILLTNGVLAEAGLNPKTDLTYLSVGVGAQALQAMRSGHVDALAISDQYYIQMEQQMGAKLRYFVGPEQHKLFSTQFFVMGSTIKERANLIEGFGRALAKGMVVSKERPEACIRMMWKQFPGTRAAGVSEEKQLETELAILKGRMTLLVTPDQTANGWGSYNPSDVEAWNKFAVIGGILPKSLTGIERLYTNKFTAGYNKFSAEDVIKKADAWKP